ncbi:MAG: DUF1800 domain-containing protein [Chloroflexi bacterium]|nr:DUF1800 domain-containing protein [Chloroflexota bacterium]MCL5275203.1 DUF1800 domain-containing protein [Chloroflexota bacterium]
MSSRNQRQSVAITRRNFLKISIAAAALAACSRIPGASAITSDSTTIGQLPATLTPATLPAATAQSPTAVPQTVEPLKRPALAWLAANRLMYGPRRGDLQHIDDIGIDGFIEEQLSSNATDDAGLQAKLAPLTTLNMNAAQLVQFSQGARANILMELEQATLLRAVYGARQLHEVMVDFWTNHFNIYFGKNQDRFLKTVDDREVIRPHTLGKFIDLLDASAHSPAMLVFLDNQTNRKGNPNENYGRELMELHTISVDGGYTQDDVVAVARAFTGWTVRGYNKNNPNPDAGQFYFNAKEHDSDAKIILGQTFPAGGGEQDGQKVLDLLAHHPHCATFISAKLARRFIADQPPSAAVLAGAAAFSKSDGDIKATLGAILHGEDFKNSFGQKVKRPLDLLASALRALDADTDAGAPLIGALALMGQPLFQWQFPNGFPDSNGAWSGAGAMLMRWNLGLALGANAIKGTHIDYPALTQGASGEAIDNLSTRLLGAPLPADVREILKPFTGDTSTLAALLLASPLFQMKG